MRHLERINYHKEHLNDHYWVLKTIGKGGFSSVKLGWHKLTQTQVAVKIVAKNDPHLSYDSSEANIMKRLCHQNIIRLYHILEDSRNIYFILEHAINGNLRDYIKAKSYLKEGKAQQFFYEITCAVQYLHARNISHRDLKPRNILVDGRETLKVCDFGLSTQFKPGQKFTNFCGTVPFTAPEMFYNDGYDGTAVDMWSLGIILYNMLVGIIPFHIFNNSQQYIWLLLPSNITEEAQDLLNQLLMLEWQKRATLDYVIQHPWLNHSHNGNGRDVKTTLPKCSYSEIVATMTTMGYKAREIQDSLRKRKFDDTMATYLILYHQMPRGLGSSSDGKPRSSGKVPCLAPSKPPITVARRRKGSVSNLHSFTLSPLRFQQEEEDQSSQNLSVKHVSLPAIPFSHMGSQAVSRLPCENTPEPGSSIEGNVGQSHFGDLSSLSLGTPSNSDNQENSDARSGRESASTCPPEVRPRLWKTFRKRVMRALRSLCSCLSARRRKSRNKIVPGQRTDSDDTR
ncbi:PREDICTED: sperm motility kinase-like [Dipodomys ordii]|uniref:non-specific serine/threonine protein kinase n=1 Tax=Dipodomys ordii TaxID=10020 RepID=A0A1S3ELZ9_DIPOR|nr:PREDICTED: sperm motility kinase-like [Dipodomys ordii]